jgi:polysaccharide export outer membrane protein
MDRATKRCGLRVRLHTLRVLACLLVTACISAGPYVWVADIKPEPGSTDYLVAAGDLLNIRVFGQEGMSTRARVRSDGRISVPFAGDVQASGKTPLALTRELETRLKSYMVTPAITVAVDEPTPTSVAVVGEVAHPGVYNIDPPFGVVRALALAGGVTDYASHDGIYVLRSTDPRRVRFTYRALTDNEPHAASFRLRAGDTVFVE